MAIARIARPPKRSASAGPKVRTVTTGNSRLEPLSRHLLQAPRPESVKQAYKEVRIGQGLG